MAKDKQRVNNKSNSSTQQQQRGEGSISSSSRSNNRSSSRNGDNNNARSLKHWRLVRALAVLIMCCPQLCYCCCCSRYHMNWLRANFATAIGFGWNSTMPYWLSSSPKQIRQQLLHANALPVNLEYVYILAPHLASFHILLSRCFPVLCLGTTSRGQWTRIPPSRSTSCPSASCHKDMRSLTMPLTRNPRRRHRPRCRHRLLRKCTARPPTIIAWATTWPTMAAMAIWCTGATTIGATWCCRLSHYRTTTRKAWATWCAAWIQISSTRPQCNPGKCWRILIPDMLELASLSCQAAAALSIIAAQLVASA